MHKTVEALLQAISQHKDEADNTLILQLTLLIEKSNAHDKNKGEYLYNLTPEQLAINLSTDEQVEVAKAIFEMLHTDFNNSGLIWATSKLQPDVLRQPLHDFLLTHGDNLSGETFYQAIIALQNCHRENPIALPKEFKQLLARRQLIGENIVRQIQYLFSWWDEKGE